MSATIAEEKLPHKLFCQKIISLSYLIPQWVDTGGGYEDIYKMQVGDFAQKTQKVISRTLQIDKEKRLQV